MSDYFRVCAIDVGYRNFAWCVVDNTSWREPLRWEHEDLWQKGGKPTKQDLVGLMVKWARTHRDILLGCDSIVLEAQIRTPFIVMNSALHALFYKRTTVVHPMTVGTFFALPKTRAEKKRAGIDVVRRYCVLPDHADHKIDDLADAWMMAVHQLVRLGGISTKEF